MKHRAAGCLSEVGDSQAVPRLGTLPLKACGSLWDVNKLCQPLMHCSVGWRDLRGLADSAVRCGAQATEVFGWGSGVVYLSYGAGSSIAYYALRVTDLEVLSVAHRLQRGLS
ncbi:hypothetical protein NDU88_007620 [Pleurodeles waltl]|uniref:Uncharacterized protein n=1 Tax=Pleurodeles waltl TaxID=8319 RepID=A0AAV7QLB9_PLEWA|nr:hypothetical protein NDU88_007620 [Pleurodeles waltl]